MQMAKLESLLASFPCIDQLNLKHNSLDCRGFLDITLKKLLTCNTPAAYWTKILKCLLIEVCCLKRKPICNWIDGLCPLWLLCYAQNFTFKINPINSIFSVISMKASPFGGEEGQNFISHYTIHFWFRQPSILITGGKLNSSAFETSPPHYSCSCLGFVCIEKNIENKSL